MYVYKNSDMYNGWELIRFKSFNHHKQIKP